MAKQSDLGRKIAKIDADLERFRWMENYLEPLAPEAAAQKCSEDIARLLEIRAYLTKDAPATPDKPKRKRKTKGLPQPGVIEE